MEIVCNSRMQMTWLCSKSKEDIKVVMGCFVEVYKRCLKFNTDKKKVMVFSEVLVHRMRLKHMSEFI